MGASDWGSDTPVTSALFAEPYRFGFYQAVRLLERMAPARTPVGRDEDPAHDVVRFRARASLTFPASEIYDLSRTSDSDEPPSMDVSFMGLTGPSGVLPVRYTEFLVDRVRQKDCALAEFLDLFNHRMISLQYRAWEKYRFAIAYERGGVDAFTAALFAVVGLGTRGLRGRLSVPDEVLLHYGGLVAQRPHSASAVRAILGDFFGVPVRILPFHGQWLALGDENLCRLGEANSSLGVDAIAGERIWDDQSKFRIELGPLALDQFRAFLPVAEWYRHALDLARFLVGDELDFDLQLVLAKDHVPACALEDDPAEAPRLGWTSWLKTEDFAEDDSQVVLDPRLLPSVEAEATLAPYDETSGAAQAASATP